MTKKPGWLAASLAALTLIGALVFFVRPDGPDRTAGFEPFGELDIGDRRGALVDEIVFTQESDLGKIIQLLEGGSHQVFGMGIDNPGIARRIRDSPLVDHSIAYGSSTELTVNPAGPRFTDGRINPFHSREIREALNWLVNRRYIADELYGGLAVPRVLPLNTAFPDYARLADTARALEIRYEYNPDRAERVIRDEMENLGATHRGGRWMHDGERVRISIIIRTDDQRHRVGDYLGNLFEELGFEVERLYRTPEEASRIWIAGDPNVGRWHLYTGGWASQLVRRDEGEVFNYLYTSRGRPEPLWQSYEPDPELDEIADRIERRDYQTWEERQDLMKRGIELAMKDSFRIWLVDTIRLWPRASNVSLSTDLAGGVAGSWLWPYTVHYRDRVGGRMVFGTPSLLTEPWNPVAGTNWVFDQLILRALSDMPVQTDPFTGLFWPQQIAEAEVVVQEGLPVSRTLDWLTLETAEEIPVPEDAWIDWDGEEQRMVSVGERHPEGLTTRAVARMRFEDDYLNRRWHDGSQISMADIVLAWVLAIERAREGSPLFDPAHVPLFQSYQRHFRGWRIVSEQPLEIETYSDQIYPDAEWIVGLRAGTALIPWHTLALGIRAEHAGELAFSSNKADQMRVGWMSYVAGPSLSILDRHLQAARAENYVPFASVLRQFLREGEVEERYRALADWRRERRHFWVGDGPFYLHSVHPVERSLVIRRFEDFPDPADKWLRFTEPEIPVLELDGPMVIEVGESAEFDLQILFNGKPYPVEAIEMARYLLFGGRGQLVKQGDAEPTEDGRWSISLSADELRELGSGANTLEVAVSSDRVAMPIFATHAFATVPPRRAAN